MYTVYGSMTSRAFRVVWLLEELGEPYTLIKAGPRSDAVRAVSAPGKIPVLQLDDGTVITDSVAIMTYLADKHGALTHPPGSVARARQDAMTFMLLDEVEGALWTSTRHTAILPEDKRVPQITGPMMADYDTAMTRLEAGFDGPFMLGETLTLTDILATHCMGWAHFQKFPPVGPKLKAYLKEMRARPAFQRTQAAGQ